MMGCVLLCLVFWQGPVYSADTLLGQTTATVYALPAIQARRTPEPWFSKDKFLHFSASAALSGLCFHVYAARLQGDIETGSLFSVSLTGLIGFSKELYDESRGGTFSWKDLIWDGLGIAVGYFVFVR